jgi:hypothetical protein
VNYNYSRFICPCCGCPALDSNAEYDICIMCNWEDDGKSDEDADIVEVALTVIIHYRMQ